MESQTCEFKQIWEDEYIKTVQSNYCKYIKYRKRHHKWIYIKIKKDKKLQRTGGRKDGQWKVLKW